MRTLVRMEPALGYYSWIMIVLTRTSQALRTVLGRQFDWGGRLPKCNGGAPRYPQHGWKSCIECKGIRVLDCETNKSSRVERRA